MLFYSIKPSERLHIVLKYQVNSNVIMTVRKHKYLCMDILFQENVYFYQQIKAKKAKST